MAKKKQPPSQPPADVSPFDESDDDETVGSPIPDDDGWVYLKAQEADREKEKHKRRRAPRRTP